MRRTGQQQDDLLPPIVFSLQPLPGSCSARVGDHLCAGDDVGLARVVLRHRDAPLGEALVHRSNQIVITSKLNPQCVGHALARQIVFGRPQASHKDDQVGALDRSAGDGGQLQPMIANDGLEGNAHAEFVELAGEVKGVGILPVRSEHLRADGHDFGDHG